ncbi:MAG: hypothetical protein II137_01835 [Anaerovibrio sp.]|nr:hypothetical protein [Anaerovibrio sp.]
MMFGLNKKLIMLMVAVLVLALSGSALAAKRVDRRFVDSGAHTGYYLDVNSIQYDNPDELTADIYIVKPLFNTMFMYTTVFDMKEHSYQFVYTKIYKYDTREVTGKSDIPSPKVGYTNAAVGNNRIMESVLDYALNWHRTHIYKTNEGELLD